MFRLFVIALAATSLGSCQKAGGKADAKAPEATAQASEPTPEGKAFLEKTAKEPGVKPLSDGILYKVVRSGPTTGLKPQLGDEIKVHYEGKLIDGTVFDSSYDRGQPAAMELRQLIPAWEKALPQMRAGDEWILYVPPAQGYGAEGTPGGPIGPNAVLVFRIELIDLLPRPGRVQQG
ncbi:MAG TPA: FKBP-type peptidyl-prolyl cis-trans isomerase [Phenylobacterium sp.]